MSFDLNNYADDTLILILSQLPLSQLQQTCQINRRFRQLCNGRLLWRLKIEEEFPDLLDSLSPTDNLKNLYIKTYNERYLTGRARMIEISDIDLKEILGNDYDHYLIFADYTNFDGIVQLLNTHINKLGNLLGNKLPQIERGDIVYLQRLGGFRNLGKFVYDGQKIQKLYTRLDEYESIPPSFQVIHEFPIRYWINVIEHNSIVFFNPRIYIDQIKENLHPLTYLPSDWYRIYNFYETHFIGKNNIKYIIVIYMPSEYRGVIDLQDIIKLLSLGIFEAIDHRDHNEDLLRSYNRDTTLVYRIGRWFQIEDFLQ